MSRQPPFENPKSRTDAPREQTPSPPRARKPNGRTTKADPSEFGKDDSAVRERMAKAIKETSPEDRMKQGR